MIPKNININVNVNVFLKHNFFQQKKKKNKNYEIKYQRIHTSVDILPFQQLY